MAGRLVTGIAHGLRLTAVTEVTQPLPTDLQFQLPDRPAALFDANGARLP
ncbi:hypothetical protein SAMN04488003_104150 [Loktanella fryxellensis]|uniref:Uncharacterized protein n=1 Tax=Loktanella fryxellensis TaxID=245187 RepID=A0A1H8B3B0_9RHOB|nr:hypothetical protein [Loktanella fryxellensis]SEM77440.1 hypothetical protein SAMN04488003_104150 [Loktanella fryxellensis]